MQEAIWFIIQVLTVLHLSSKKTIVCLCDSMKTNYDYSGNHEHVIFRF